MHAEIDLRNTTEYLLNEIAKQADTLALLQTDINLLRRNDLLSKGVSGFKTVSGSAAQTAVAGTYWAIYFIKDTTPTTLTITLGTTVTGIVYKAGTWIYGDVRAITGDSGGAYILYHGDAAL